MEASKKNKLSGRDHAEMLEPMLRGVFYPGRTWYIIDPEDEECLFDEDEENFTV